MIAAEGYLELLQALLPRGAAWTRERTATLTSLLDALAADLARIDADAADLLAEINPSTTLDMLPDWERVVGLPDDCSPAETVDVATRRNLLVSLLAYSPAVTPAALERLALSMGYTSAAVLEHRRSSAEAIAGLDTAGGRWRFVWWLRTEGGAGQYFTTLSTAADPLVVYDPRDTELACRVRAVMPAHTHIVIEHQGR